MRVVGLFHVSAAVGAIGSLADSGKQNHPAAGLPMMTVYGHIFDADLDDLAARLEDLGRDADGMTVERLIDRRSG